jgi:hypothetical protein
VEEEKRSAHEVLVSIAIGIFFIAVFIKILFF